MNPLNAVPTAELAHSEIDHHQLHHAFKRQLSFSQENEECSPSKRKRNSLSRNVSFSAQQETVLFDKTESSSNLSLGVSVSSASIGSCNSDRWSPSSTSSQQKNSTWNVPVSSGNRWGTGVPPSRISRPMNMFFSSNGSSSTPYQQGSSVVIAPPLPNASSANSEFSVPLPRNPSFSKGASSAGLRMLSSSLSYSNLRKHQKVLHPSQAHSPSNSMLTAPKVPERCASPALRGAPRCPARTASPIPTFEQTSRELQSESDADAAREVIRVVSNDFNPTA